jgi:hypothetical protein
LLILHFCTPQIELYDFRAYVGAPLTHAQVAAIASNPPAVIPASDLCVLPTDPAYQDTAWTDTFGHTCDWYFEKAKTNKDVCLYPEVAVKCPIACASRQECFNDQDYKAYFTWKSIMRIEPKGVNGSLCYSDKHNISEVYRKCVEYRQTMASDSVVSHACTLHEQNCACSQLYTIKNHVSITA